MTDTKPATDPAVEAIKKLASHCGPSYLSDQHLRAEEIIRQAYAPILAAAEELYQIVENTRDMLDAYWDRGEDALATYRELVRKE